MGFWIWIGLFLILLALLNRTAGAVSDSIIQKQLNRFKKNPARALNALPLKWNSKGKRIKYSDSYFPKRAIRSRDYITEKDKTRRGLMSREDKNVQVEPSIMAPGHPSQMEKIQGFIENRTTLNTLEQIEALNLTKGKTKSETWSGYYWPLFKGALGYRYSEPELFGKYYWEDQHNYVLENPMKKIVRSQNKRKIRSLSPSEKYDLLMGGDLTASQWDSGKVYFEKYGKVEKWMGVCHGWAVASYKLKRPEKVIQLMAADGKTVLTFYPSDVKALASLAWATANAPVRFLGDRCHDKKPNEDEHGRIISEKCFDSNPAVWHLALVNRLGRFKRSFVMDATYDYQVWNYPVISYEYKYFDPKTLETVKSLNQARVKLSAFEKDKFKKYRSPDAKEIVGIAMTVVVGHGQSPNSLENSADDDETMSILYMYDLELDANGEIIGGEWYNNRHPDFLWAPPKGVKAHSIGDFRIHGDPLWDGKSEMPTLWRKAARISSSFGQPLLKVVESLIRLTRK